MSCLGKYSSAKLEKLANAACGYQRNQVPNDQSTLQTADRRVVWYPRHDVPETIDAPTESGCDTIFIPLRIARESGMFCLVFV